MDGVLSKIFKQDGYELSDFDGVMIINALNIVAEQNLRKELAKMMKKGNCTSFISVLIK